MYITMDTKKRRYDMQARGESTAATRNAIVEAAIDTVVAERSLGITLGAVAERAGVTVKTVLRHFGSRESLIEAAYLAVRQAVQAEESRHPGMPKRQSRYSSRTMRVAGTWCSACSPRRRTIPERD